jgi:hypothetical protein
VDREDRKTNDPVRNRRPGLLKGSWGKGDGPAVGPPAQEITGPQSLIKPTIFVENSLQTVMETVKQKQTHFQRL